ncbi:MAG: transposase [Bacteroidetes bacterium CG02_land_8_20_14_3_00_31_25]|nr:transposase [Bacteroidota bacterium]PIV58517.1 MAG: transposase [Bacteroidetes bacterium CG02_land_8_20_14_3_00_31_25]
MSWVRVYIHMVFSTKNREPFLNSSSLRKSVFQHFKQNASEKGIWLDCVNGYQEHTHCLISLGKEQTISKVAQLIKGESSFWINKNKLTKQKFNWQDDFWAIGVSESHLKAVRNYIYEQETHHKTVSFSQELDAFMKKYGWQLIKECG